MRLQDGALTLLDLEQTPVQLGLADKEEVFLGLDPTEWPVLCIRSAQFGPDIGGRAADRLISETLRRLTPLPHVIISSHERHWLPMRAVEALKRFFHQACVQIAVRLRSHRRYPEVGLTSELVFRIFDDREHQHFVRELLIPTGVALDIECEESGSAESALGSDLGFCVTVCGPDLHTRRAILCQAKRLHPEGDVFRSSSRYGTLFGTQGRDQAKKMLDITPCSHFLLYSPLHLESLLNSEQDSRRIRNSVDHADDGIGVLPAAFVKDTEGNTWAGVADAYPFSSSFTTFMVDDFIQGKLGDTRQAVLAASLTKGQRLAVKIPDDPKIPIPRFSVTFTFDVAPHRAESSRPLIERPPSPDGEFTGQLRAAHRRLTGLIVGGEVTASASTDGRTCNARIRLP